MLTAHKISKSFDFTPILKDISFSVNAGERVGLIGPNGCGKTTLFRILTGEIRPDSGHISLTPANLRLGYLPQGFAPPAGLTLGEILQQASNDPEIFEAELARLATELARNPHQPDLQNAYDQILAKLEAPSNLGALQSVLAAFELDHLPETQPVATLSGGQKTRLSLALVLIANPEFLLLDEPTNHLDIAMLEWLEDWLAEFRGAALIVSHDRAFLEQTVTKILDLNPETQSLRIYEGSYSDYIEQINTELNKQWQNYNDQVAEIRKMKRDIARTRAQAERTEREASSIRIGGGMMKLKGYKDYQQGIAKKVARKAKSRQKRLDRYLDSDERVEKPKAGWQMKLTFDTPQHLSKDVVRLEELSVGYPGCEPLLTGLSLYIQAGKRIAFTGPNGAGKTTLLRTIAGQLTPVGGSVRLGASVNMGYMSQEQENLDPHQNAVAAIQAISSMDHTDTRNFLHHFLFSGDDPLRPIQQLSYGERARLMLAKLVASGCNFLVLDEPINHLDIPSRERFEQALNQFDGTILAVIHDRYFIQRFATDLWVLENQSLQQKVLIAA